MLVKWRERTWDQWTDAPMANGASAKLDWRKAAASSLSSSGVSRRRGAKQGPQAIPDQVSMVLIAGSMGNRSVIAISSLIRS